MKNPLSIVTKFLIVYFVFVAIVVTYGNYNVSQRTASATPQIITKVIKQENRSVETTKPSVQTTAPSPTITAYSTKDISVQATIPPATPAPTTAPTPQVVTLKDQVSQHSSSSDCWMIINDHVFDVTSYFGMHPGGNELLKKYCGKNATAAFKTKDKANSSDHSQTAYSILEQYRID